MHHTSRPSLPKSSVRTTVTMGLTECLGQILAVLDGE